MKSIVDWYYIGYNDGLANKPKQKVSNHNKRAYLNGYSEGSKERSKGKTK